MSFWRAAEEAPDRLALVGPDGTPVAAGDLAAASHRLTHGLRARGLTAGDSVAVAMKNGVAFIELYLAAMQAGLIFVPMHPGLSPVESDAVLGAAGARIVLSDPAAIAELQAGQPSTAPAERRCGAVAFVSSGTTGTPRVRRPPLSAAPPDGPMARASQRRLGVAGIAPGGDTVHLVAAPLHHSATLGWCTAHLHAGHTIVLSDGWSAEGTLASIARHRVTATFMVPTHFHRLLALPDEIRARHDVGSLRHVIHGGAPCPVERKRRMLAWWGPVIHEVYGAAEAEVGTHVGAEEWLAHPGTVGRAGATVRVLRADGSTCAPGEVGEVHFRPGGFAGDLGHVDADGYLFLDDRQSDVIISGGVNVYPAEVEAALAAHPLVEDAAVFGIPDDEWGEQVKAAVVGPPGIADDLLGFCRARLAASKCPRSIDLVATLPRGADGKLQRRRLREPYWAGRERKP